MIPISLILYTLDSDEDRDKLSQIYENYLGFMTHFARKYVGKYSAEEDVVHNSIIRLINNLEKIDLKNVSETQSYIRQAVTWCSLDWLRKEKNDLDMEDVDDPLLNIEDDILMPLDQIISEDGYDYLVQSIRSLKDSYRLVCEMHLLDKMTYEQIANKLGITAKNVSVRYTRGMKELKAKLKEGGYYDEQIRK